MPNTHRVSRAPMLAATLIEQDMAELNEQAG
jgi:hypothetical protein